MDTAENNQTVISGTILQEFTFSHEVHGEKFFTTNLSVRRLSDHYDIVPVIVSDKLLDMTTDYTGMCAKITGQFRSYNLHEETTNHLLLSVLAKDIAITEEPIDDADGNHAFLSGYVCKPVNYRKTPADREIADMILAVNRPYGKADYIPCICWGKNARFAANLPIGEQIRVWGRIQSRTYQKSTAEGTKERTTYELSVSKLEVTNPIPA